MMTERVGQKSTVQKLALAAIMAAVAVVLSPFSIPVGASKCFPVQHFVNVLAAVVLGPGYAVGMAFVTSLIRVMTGMGTLLAFPGSMVGALCAALAYKYSHKLLMAYIGEVIGTGILGALAAYPVAVLIMGKEAALFAYVGPFMISTAGGALIALLLLTALKKTGALKRFIKL